MGTDGILFIKHSRDNVRKFTVNNTHPLLRVIRDYLCVAGPDIICKKHSIAMQQMIWQNKQTNKKNHDHCNIEKEGRLITHM